MNLTYRIEGGIPLRGDVTVGGSKNAALPLLAGSILCSGETVLRNVPRLRDIEVMLDILRYLGAETSFVENIVRIRAEKLTNKPIPAELVCKLRGSIVLLGPMLARFGVVEMAYPGGCVLGKRPVGAHVAALMQMGAENMSTEDTIHLQGKLRPGTVILPEFSVTATENAVLAASVLPGETTVHIAAAEPHVQDIEHFATKLGAKIDGIGTHTVTIRGTSSPGSVDHSVTPDYLETGAFVLAALVTGGRVRIHGADVSHLTMFLDAIRRMGGVWKYNASEGTLFVDGEISSLSALRVQTLIYPGFPTDLMAPMGVAMTQAKGVSRIFETLFEGRMAYLYELEKMGAHIEVLNAHEALIIGPTELRGRQVASNDIRAGAAMVLAGLCASGVTTVTDIRYIERGYDRLDEKLRMLGANIERHGE